LCTFKFVLPVFITLESDILGLPPATASGGDVNISYDSADAAGLCASGLMALVV